MADKVLTLELAMGKLDELARSVPALRKIAGDKIVQAVIRRGVREIVGGTLAASGVNRDHARYFAATFTAQLQDDGESITTGLPANEQEARILQHRETGGTILPKADRPNPYLRVPLPAALLPSGYERESNTGRLFRNRRPYSTSPFALKTRTQLEAEGKPVPARGNAFLVHRASGVPWYVLARSTTQRPFPWWTNASVKARDDVAGELDAALRAWEAQQKGTTT